MSTFSEKHSLLPKSPQSTEPRNHGPENRLDDVTQFFLFICASTAIRSFEAGIVSSMMSDIQSDLNLDYKDEGTIARLWHYCWCAARNSYIPLSFPSSAIYTQFGHDWHIPCYLDMLLVSMHDYPRVCEGLWWFFYGRMPQHIIPSGLIDEDTQKQFGLPALTCHY